MITRSGSYFCAFVIICVGRLFVELRPSGQSQTQWTLPSMTQSYKAGPDKGSQEVDLHTMF